MTDVRKECWVRREEFKLFNIKLWELTTWCDSSNFNKQNGSYLIPKCFQSGADDRQ